MGRTNMTSGINTKDATAVAGDILSGKTAYAKSKKLTGTMANRGAKTFTPSASKQTSQAGYYSSVTCNAVANLSAANIKKGATVGGVAGTYTEDATADASDIIKNKTAYINGNKVTGTLLPSENDIKTGVTIANVTGTYTSDATAEANDIQPGKTAYVNGNKITGTSKAIEINGIIENYKVEAGQNVNIGDFVTFINRTATGTDTKITTGSNTGAAMSAIKLSENKVFIAHTGEDRKELYGVVCTIDGTTITVGTDTQISSESYITIINGVALLENKVFIAFLNAAYVYGIVCTIDEDNITAGTKLTITTGAYENLSVTMLSSTSVAIIYSEGSAYSLSAVAVTITGTTIKTGNSININTTSNSGKSAYSVALSNTTIFISYGVSDSILTGIICTVSGKTITAGTETQLAPAFPTHTSHWSQDEIIKQTSAVLLSNNKILINFVTALYGGLNYGTGKIYGLLCTTNNTAITSYEMKEIADFTVSLISTSLGQKHRISTTLISEQKVLITYCEDNTNKYLNSIICNIDEMNINVSSSTQLSAAATSGLIISPVALSDNKVFIAHSLNDLTYAMIGNAIYTVKKNATNEVINGIANKSATSGNETEVYIPNV